MPTAKLVCNKLVWLKDRSDRFNSGKSAQRLFTNFIFRANYANNNALFAAADFAFETPGTDSGNNMTNLLLGRIGTGDNDH
jgi:hypothetical protein